MQDELTHEDKQNLLHMAREALEHGVRGQKLPPLDYSMLSVRLHEPGASFVTLTINAELRGCIGILEARQPLAEDVREHAIAAALEDPRFPPVREVELSRIKIEVSRLTRPLPLAYRDAADLISKLRPQVDGVILADGYRRATFLPQVWEKLPEPAEFLNYLCNKLGLSENAWRVKHLDVFVYQVEEFHE